jgi:hypothetical protein
MEDTRKFGGKKIAMITFIAGVALFQLIFWTIIKPKPTPEPITTECKADSLQNVIFSLQSDIKILDKDFHRIVGMRERYSHELEKENIKHLKL